MARSWDGAVYDRVSGVMQQLAEGVLDRLPLEGGEVVLDAGCGSGRVSELLAARVPEGMVYAVDADPSMISAARSRLSHLPNVQVFEADLLSLRLPSRVDAVLSTAVFHWIDDHQRLFLSLFSVMNPGARLCAQCGGEGNIRAVHGAAFQVASLPPFRRFLYDFTPPVHFAAPDPTRELLLHAGFSSVDCWLSDNPVYPEHPHEFLGSVILTPFLDELPGELREPFISEVLARLPDPLLVDYVRLNIDARA